MICVAREAGRSTAIKKGTRQDGPVFCVSPLCVHIFFSWRAFCHSIHYQDGDSANLWESRKEKFTGRMMSVNSWVGMMCDWWNTGLHRHEVQGKVKAVSREALAKKGIALFWHRYLCQIVLRCFRGSVGHTAVNMELLSFFSLKPVFSLTALSDV